jgi:uncharacterized protein
MTTKPKMAIIPGNGDSKIESSNWYGWVRDELIKLGYEVIARDMPDPVVAHMNIWLPFMEQKLKLDENMVVIGHSSGAVATLRYLETHQLLGAILTGVNYTDLGYPDEKEAGYYDNPWQWEKIKKNAKWIVQFDSTDDPFIPVKEPRLIHDKLKTDYREFTNRGHFMEPTFPEIIEVIKEKAK